MSGGKQGVGQPAARREALTGAPGHRGPLQRLERAGSTGGAGEGFELAEGRDVVRGQAEHCLEGGGGGLPVGERVELEGRHLEQAVGAGPRIRARLGHALERADEPGPVPLTTLDASQRAEPGAMVRVAPEHLVPGGTGGLEVDEPGFLEIGDARPELDGAGRPGQLGLAAVHLAELLPAPLARVEPAEGLEGGEVGPVGAEEPLQRVDGRAGIVEALLQHLRGAVPEGDGVRRVRRELRLALEQGHQLGPGRAALGEPGQVHQRGEVVRGEVQGAPERVGGELQVSEVLLGLLGDPAERRHAIGRVADREQLLLVERDELAPALLAPQHPLEALPGREVARDELERLAEAGQRLVGAAEARIEDLRRAEVELGPRPGVSHPGQLGVVHRDERRPILRLGVEPSQPGQGRRMSRHPHQHRLVALDRDRVPVEGVLEQRGQAQLHRDPLPLVTHRVGERAEHVGQLLGASERLVQRCQRREDRRISGRLVPGGVQRGHRVLGPLLADVRPGERGVGRERRGSSELCLGGEHRDGRLVVAGRLGGVAERAERDRVAAVERERLLPPGERLLVLPEPLVEGGGGLQRVGRELRVGEGAGEEDLHPEQPGHVAVRGEHSLRLDQQSQVGGLELERTGQGPGRGIPAVQPVGEHLGLLEEQRGAEARSLGGGELRLQELEHHGPVAHVGEDAPRRAEVLHEPRREPVGGLERGGGGAEVAQRALPEQSELVVEARAPRVGLQRLRLALQRRDPGAHLGGFALARAGRRATRTRLPLDGHAAWAAARSAPESMSAETASMSRWISRSSSMEGTTSRTRAWAAATPRPARSGRRKSSACAATSTSMARHVRAKSTTCAGLERRGHAHAHVVLAAGRGGDGVDRGRVAEDAGLGDQRRGGDLGDHEAGVEARVLRQERRQPRSAPGSPAAPPAAR